MSKRVFRKDIDSYFLLVTFYLISYQSCWAQIQALTQVIEIDTTTNAPKQSLPFDQPFILQLPLDQAKGVSSVYLVKHAFNFDLENTIRYRIQNLATGNTYQLEKKIDNKYLSEKLDSKGKNFLRLAIRDNNLLDPGQRYSIIISTAPSTTVINLFDITHRYNVEADVTKKGKLYQELKDECTKISDLIMNKLGIRWKILPDDLGAKQVTNTYRASTIVPASFKEIYNSVESMNTSISNANQDTKFNSQSSLTKFLKIIVNWDASLDKEYKSANVSTSSQIQLINSLYTITKPQYLSAIQGTVALGCLDCEPIDLKDYEGRLKNITATLDLLNKFRSASFLLNTKYGGELTDADGNLYVKLDNLINEIKKDYQLKLKSIVKEKGKILKDIGKTDLFDDVQIVDSDSYILTFTTRSKLSIVPDFGVVFPAYVKSGNELDYKFLPYLGFQINLRPINKDLPFWRYRHHWNHFPTIQIGYTLVSVARDNKRVNFFEKSAFLTGVGIRLSNYLKVNYGRIWFFAPVTGQTDLKFSSLGYIGLSLDFDIAQITNDFVKNIFPGLSKSRTTTSIP